MKILPPCPQPTCRRLLGRARSYTRAAIKASPMEAGIRDGEGLACSNQSRPPPALLGRLHSAGQERTLPPHLPPRPHQPEAAGEHHVPIGCSLVGIGEDPFPVRAGDRQVFARMRPVYPGPMSSIPENLLVC